MFRITNVFVGIFMTLFISHSVYAGNSGSPISLKRIHLTALLGLAGMSGSGSKVVAAPVDISLNPANPQSTQFKVTLPSKAVGRLHRPYRGTVPWSVLLCKFKDSDVSPKYIDYYQDMFVNPGTGGVDDYWKNISYNNINVETSVVQGWYVEPFTFAEAKTRSRQQFFQDCIDAAANDEFLPYSPPPGQFVAVITYPDLDGFGLYGVGAFVGGDVSLGEMIHEVGHGMDLEHSFSDDPNFRDASWSQIGEYDDQWDLMSYANVYSSPTARFGNAPPGLNAFYRDRMGWIPRSRILTFGAAGETSSVINLAPLDNPSIDGYLQVRVPFDPGDPFHYYTVEFRKKEGWDSAIPNDIILIHEIKKDPNTGHYLSYLIRHHEQPRDPVTSLNLNGVIINLENYISETSQATISISSDYKDRCLMGYVWRGANPSDYVCVTPDIRAQTWIDNAAAPSRVNPNGGPFGPDTCLQGYVWRDAFPGDHVCVTPNTRAQAVVDNGQANNRKNPARFVYGPNTCQNGYVWREADDTDYVCVTPDIRSQTWADNAAASSRVNPNGGPFGPDTCRDGFVWRDAFPGDHVCVVPNTRSQAQVDNAEAGNRLVIY